MHPDVAARLERLAPDQRAAATAPPGPSLCIAPAGSGKTTTLVARAAWLIDSGVEPDTIRAITFNKRAATEMSERLDTAVAALGVESGAVRVQTFHALGREILRNAGVAVEPLADRPALLAEVAPGTDEASLLRLDTAISRLKIELGVTADDVAGDPEAGPIARAFVAYERAVEASGGLDFDDLILRSIEALEGDDELLAIWRQRCTELLVDEVQDVDRAQLRLALLLAAPANRIFLVGDDDQSIYGWRLADVRRILGLEASLPGLRRVDLTVNYRCPARVVERAVRLVEHNGERFDKTIRAGPDASGRLVLAPDAADETVRLERAIGTWPDDGTTRAVLARTNRELLPAVVVAIRLGLPFRAPRIDLPLESPLVDEVLQRAADLALAPDEPPLLALGRVRRSVPVGDRETDGIVASLLGWSVGAATLDQCRTTLTDARARLAALRSDDALLTLATAHATKGLEFDHVIVVGMEAGRFPSARSVGSADDPMRAYEEERRLAYVAWTRARRTLTLLYDPAVPSPFLLEAFDSVELGLEASAAYDGVMSRLPTLGPRGEGWVLVQGILLVLVAAAGWSLGAGWPGPLRLAGVLVGSALMFCGVALALRAATDMGTVITPLPKPRQDGHLVDTGAFAIVRHPVYAGLILVGLGWGVVMASAMAIVLTALLAAFFYLKSLREEAWLEARYPDYPAYRARTPRFIPWPGRSRGSGGRSRRGTAR
jgi:protein-S-isoprenylcysteine O-methyltransferase Ste14